MVDRSLVALQERLADHLARRPLAPAWPYEVHGPVGVKYHRDLTLWLDLRNRLEHEIGKLTLPQTVFVRVAPRAVPHTFPARPVRLRQ